MESPRGQVKVNPLFLPQHVTHLLCMLLLAARMDNALPASPHKLESLIGATEPVELESLRSFMPQGTISRIVCAWRC